MVLEFYREAKRLLQSIGMQEPAIPVVGKFEDTPEYQTAMLLGGLKQKGSREALRTLLAPVDPTRPSFYPVFSRDALEEIVGLQDLQGEWYEARRLARRNPSDTADIRKVEKGEGWARTQTFDSVTTDLTSNVGYKREGDKGFSRAILTYVPGGSDPPIRSDRVILETRPYNEDPYRREIVPCKVVIYFDAKGQTRIRFPKEVTFDRYGRKIEVIDSDIY